MKDLFKKIDELLDSMEGEPIGKATMKATVSCSICGKKHRRKTARFVYENTPAHLEAVKQDMIKTLSKPYTCSICKSIKKW